jgi:hypothetical protein
MKSSETKVCCESIEIKPNILIEAIGPKLDDQTAYKTNSSTCSSIQAGINPHAYTDASSTNAA